MDQLVLAAATALVTAMATDGWQEARASAVALWRRVHPTRVLAIEAELKEVRTELLAAREAGDFQVEDELIADWRRRLGYLVAGQPDLVDELQQLVNESWLPLLSRTDQTRVANVTQKANAWGHGRVYQAGRDQHIHERRLARVSRRWNSRHQQVGSPGSSRPREIWLSSRLRRLIV